MKVTDTFKETAYQDIKAGTVFKHEEKYYMATEEITDSFDDIYSNCVNLESGEHNYFEADDMVEILEAELIVK